MCTKMLKNTHTSATDPDRLHTHSDTLSMSFPIMDNDYPMIMIMSCAPVNETILIIF